MNKPLLSILIPVAPNRQERLHAVLSRLNLNSCRFPDHSFEVVVVDGGATDDTQKLCMTFANYMNLKYIYCPIEKFICAAYPRNIGLRVCEGEVIGMIDIDHWPSENIVFGMLTPFIDDSEFRFAFSKDRIDKIKNLMVPEDIQIGMSNFIATDVINRGYVIDSSKSKRFVGQHALERLNEQILSHEAMGYIIQDAYVQAQIPPPGQNNTLWTWAVKRRNILPLNGYDEMYCRQFAYSREDDDWRQRLLAQGLPFYDGQNKNFCAIHLWHPAACRRNAANEINKMYYQAVCGEGIQNPQIAQKQCKNIKRNENHPWGKLLKYSFSVMHGKHREVDEHEKWIEKNIVDMPSYVGIEPHKNANAFVESLER